jgi:flagellar hook-associated protein 1
MTAIYSVMSLAGKALLTHQKAINVTANNIANVNTPGYSRQKLILATSTPSLSNIGLMGTGVEAVGIERIYDRFLGLQINTETESLGRWQAQKDVLDEVEIIFDESVDFGLSQSLNDFWNAWQDLTNNPSGYNERLVLQAKSEVLANTFQRIYSDLQSAQRGIDARIEGTIEEINRLSREIADLNQKIMETEAGGYRANDYRDKRDAALKELAQRIDISTFEDASGRVAVSVADGRTLVEGNSFRSLATADNDGHKNIQWVADDGTFVDITASITGGRLKGWIDGRDVSIADYLSQLDMLAQGIADAVNSLHQGGYGLDGSTGNDFFVISAANAAAGIQINPAIVDNLDLIAAASSSLGIPGDNGNALAIADLQQALTMNGNAVTFDDYFHSLVAQVGEQVQRTNAYYSHQAEMVVQLENRRESISGVSLDEEMMNLIKFQHAYNAAAKLVATADELMQTVLNMI